MPLNVVEGASQGALTGASVGAVFGPPGAIIGGVGGGIVGGLLSRKKATKSQKQRQELIDQLLFSLNNEGPYSDLFNMDEGAFQKSYVDNAKQLFNDQIAPQIQERFIASGQHRGTPMETALTRAGVDLDQILNQNYAGFQNQGQNNKLAVINSILNQEKGSVPATNQDQSYSEAAKQGISGYLETPKFREDLTALLQSFKDMKSKRAGFES